MTSNSNYRYSYDCENLQAINFFKVSEMRMPEGFSRTSSFSLRAKKVSCPDGFLQYKSEDSSQLFYFSLPLSFQEPVGITVACVLRLQKQRKNVSGLAHI